MRLFHKFKRPEEANPHCDLCGRTFREHDDWIVPRVRFEGVSRICNGCATRAEKEFYQPLVEIFKRIKEEHSREA